jgi:hypothetical protein
MTDEADLMTSELQTLRKLADCVRAEETHRKRIERNVLGPKRFSEEDWESEVAACRKEGRALRKLRLRLLRELRLCR